VGFKYNQALFHIGSPLRAKPDHSLAGIQKFIMENRSWAICFIIDSEDERKELAEAMEKIKLPDFHPGGVIIPWEDDTSMMDMICGDMHFLKVWKVVAPAWYECPDGHILPSTLGKPREACDCGKPLEFKKHAEEKVERFKEVLKNAAALMNFDGRSGEILNEGGLRGTTNLMRNMIHAEGCKHEEVLKLESFDGKGKGGTAICIASGPSLTAALPHLKRIHGRYTTLTTGRNFKLLKAEGIHVDYVFTCEMFDWDAVIFDGITKEDAGDTILVFPPVASPSAVAKWPGKRVCTWDVASAELLEKPRAMTGGNSIAHHMFNFATEIMEHEEVILVGQDLAYTTPDGLTHAEGTSHAWPSEVAFQDKEKHGSIEWYPCTGKGPFYPDCHQQPVMLGGGVGIIGGPLVKSSKPYKNFGTLFEILIARNRKVTPKIWNACGNGLKIVGTEYVDLASIP
jgi:hypothetical protein